MDGVSQLVGAEDGSQRPRRLLLGLHRVRWPKKSSEILHGVASHELHAGDYIALHLRRQIRKEWRALMLLVELINLSSFRKLAHLQLGNRETVFIERINNLASLNVTVWFYERKSPSCVRFKLISRKDVGVVHQLELSGMDVYDRPQEQLTNRKTRTWHSLHEDPLILQIILHKNEN